MQTASSNFSAAALWVIAVLYDAVYLYLRTVDKMIRSGLNFRDATQLFNLSQTTTFIGWWFIVITF